MPTDSVERPALGAASNMLFGSDVVADVLRALDIPYITLTPGASFRGLHDSLVNYLGNERPQILLCLHEEHAIAIAHGWAKVTGSPLAAALHSNVGLFHASMAIFNAWCDRMPLLIVGATGPVDAIRRRPWIDWIHTARDQGAIVRPYTKWDDQPASPAAAREAICRAVWLSTSVPMAPVYVNLDAGMQEQAVREPLAPIDVARLVPAVRPGASQGLVAEAASVLKGAARPVIMIGRVSRSEQAWAQRVSLAEALGAEVITDLKVGAAFPTDHPQHVAPPAVFMSPEAGKAVAGADVILSLDWVDLGGTLRSAGGGGPIAARVIQVSLDQQLHNGWSMDHQGLPEVDLFLAADPDTVVPMMLDALGVRRVGLQPHVPPSQPGSEPGTGPVTVPQMGRMLRNSVGAREVSLLHLPSSWDAAVWPFHHPLDYVGSDGGAGLGAGPGISVGAALALRGSGRVPISICGDGDFLMGVTALWTATHYRIPLLMVIANNRSYYNDEVHQERMALMRNRPVENKWIGQHIADPDIDFAQLAKAQGATGFGPVREPADIRDAFDKAIKVVEEGGLALVDVRVAPGYTPAMASALAQQSAGSKDS